MRFGVAVGLATCVVIGVAAPGDEAVQGTWRLKAGQADGKPYSKAQLAAGKLVVEGEHYTVTLAGKGTVTGTETLDPAKDPKTIDITDARGPNQGKTCLGLYEVNGDEFRAVFAPPGKPRPTEFTTAPNSGQWMNVWERVKK